MPNWKKVITSGSDASLNKLVVDGSIGHVSASLFSGSFYGDGSNLTGIAGGIFAQTGSIYATTNELEVSGSLVISQSSNGQAIDILNTGSRWRQYIDSNGHITLNASGSGNNTNVNYTLEKGNFQLNLKEGHFNLDIDTTGKDFRIRDSGNVTYFVVTGDKKVGIGEAVGITPDQDVDIAGTVRIRDYGSGNKTGTLAYTLGVDSNGDIIETTTVDTSGTPANNQVAVFTDADTIEGHNKFLYDSTTEQVTTPKVKASTSIAVGALTPSTTVGRIDAANDIVAYSTSDQRLKENVVPIKNALKKVHQIRGVEFDWKELSEQEKEKVHGNTGHDIGVLAQEIEQILPEAVQTRENGYKAVRYEKIVPLLIQAINELQEKLDGLTK